MRLTRRNPSSDVTDTLAFRRWFGKSVVVDEESKPQRVYHITTGDFDTFVPGGPNPLVSGRAIWLTPYPHKIPAGHSVGGWEGNYRQGARVLPLYAKIERPLYITDEDEAAFARRKFTDTSRGSAFPLYITDEELAKVKKAGYDGIIYAHWLSAEGFDFKTGRGVEIIVFEPTQVKSATANVGTFDPEDPSILRNPRRRSNPFQRRATVPAGFTVSPYTLVRGTVLEMVVDPQENGRADSGTGFFHVTTNLPAVLAEGRLRSRAQLRAAGVKSAGLGGGIHDEAPHLISVGLTLDGAMRVMEATRLMADAVHGRIDSKTAMKALDKSLAPALDLIDSAADWMGEDPDSDEFDVANEYDETKGNLRRDALQATPGPELYTALKQYEEHVANTLAEWESEGYLDTSESPCSQPVGFTEPAHKFERVMPENIGLVQLAARRTARPDPVPGECELRFRPEDLVIVAVWQSSPTKRVPPLRKNAATGYEQGVARDGTTVRLEWHFQPNGAVYTVSDTVRGVFMRTMDPDKAQEAFMAAFEAHGGRTTAGPHQDGKGRTRHWVMPVQSVNPHLRRKR